MTPDEMHLDAIQPSKETVHGFIAYLLQGFRMSEWKTQWQLRW